MKNKSLIIVILYVICGSYFAHGQDDLLDILSEEITDSVSDTRATFKTTRIGLGQSVETRKKGTFEFTLGTRYWNVAMAGTRSSFVADRFSGNLGVEYAFTDKFSSGLKATSFDGAVNVYGKYRLLKQQDGKGNNPLGITFFQGSSLLTRSASGIILPENFSDRFSFVSQLIFARKFNRNLSLQFSPAYVHTNVRQLTFDTNDHLVLGFGGRYRLSGHVSLTSEYYYLLGRDEGSQGYDSFALGANWELGDVIVQFSMTNAKSFDETTTFLFTPNNFNFDDGGLHFGVNITYILHTNTRKKP